MIRSYNVVTPFSRFENLRSLIDMLSAHRSSKFELRWHLLIDNDLPFAVRFPQSWIYVHYSPPSTPFWSRWADALNRFISSGVIEDDHRYQILNDDDGVEPGFFEKVDAVEGDVIAVSMKRGMRTPAGVAAERAHGTGTLVAQPDRMIPGQVGAEQIICAGKIFAAHGLENRIDADGYRIMAIVKANAERVVYLPETYVLFNYYEPGRWDK